MPPGAEPVTASCTSSDTARPLKPAVRAPEGAAVPAPSARQRPAPARPRSPESGGADGAGSPSRGAAAGASIPTARRPCPTRKARERGRRFLFRGEDRQPLVAVQLLERLEDLPDDD